MDLSRIARPAGSFRRQPPCLVQLLDRFLFFTGLQQSDTKVVGDKPGEARIVLQVIEHFDGVVRPVCRHIDVRPQKLDIVLYLCGHGALDSSQSLQCIVELILLEVNAGEPERGFVSYGFIDSTFKHSLDGASSSIVHAVVEFEIADREFGLVDVIVKRIESGFVQTVVLCQFGVEPLDCFEILALVGVIERFVEKEIVLLRSLPSLSSPASTGLAARASTRPSQAESDYAANRSHRLQLPKRDRGAAGVRSGDCQFHQLWLNFLMERKVLRAVEVRAAL